MAQAGLVHGPSLNEPPSGPDTGPVCDSHSSQQLRAGFGRIHRFTRCPGRFRPVMSACSLATLAEEIAACRLCPRLVEHREAVAVKKRASFRDWTYWARGVPGFGDPDARVLVIGLAPGAHGANRTGRVFTGDASGRFLWAALYETGFASQPTSDHVADGLALKDLYVTAALRCAPPQDRPNGNELSNCMPFLARELGLLPRVRLAVALGRVGFEAFLRYASQVRPEAPEAALQAWRSLRSGGRSSSGLVLLPPQPSKHQYGQADLRRLGGDHAPGALPGGPAGDPAMTPKAPAAFEKPERDS